MTRKKKEMRGNQITSGGEVVALGKFKDNRHFFIDVKVKEG
jgi:hypothetical protein